MLKNKFLQLGLVIIYFFVAEILLSPIRGTLGMVYCSVIGFVSFFLMEYFILKEQKVSKPLIILFCSILGFVLFQSILRLNHFNEALVSLPDAVFHLLGIITGYFFYFSKKISFKVVLVILSIIANFFIFNFGYKMWLYKLSFGNINGNVSLKITFPISYKVENNNSIFKINENINQITLVDFWHVRCGICFEKFPILEKYYKENKNNTKLKIISLNRGLKSDTLNQAYNVLKNRGFTFPAGILEDNNILDSLDIFTYPTVILIDRNQKVFYKGDIEGAINKLNTIIK